MFLGRPAGTECSSTASNWVITPDVKHPTRFSVFFTAKNDFVEAET